MNIISIEPTPSPNSMKINLDESLPDHVRLNYKAEQKEQAPALIQQLLSIPDVTEVFHTSNFIALERKPKGDWQSILADVRDVFIRNQGLSNLNTNTTHTIEAAEHVRKEESANTDHFGEAQVLVQMFRGIPLQIRVQSDNQEERVAMPSRFIDTAMKAQYGSPNLIAERKLVDYGVRYGDRKEIAEQMLAELEAAFDTERLAQLASEALQAGEGTEAGIRAENEDLLSGLNDSNWKVRFAALDRIKPSLQTLPLIIVASKDDNFSIRRLATVYLGDIKKPEVLPHLFRMLKDSSAPVRRTAGDCLSDIGNPDAIGPMCEALQDPSKIVRWRAARFLYELGDESTIPALKQALGDPEFEVRMQIQYALARIESGEAAVGSVWQQMTERNR